MSTPFSDNLRGAGFMMLSMAGFALNDAAMKSVLENQPLFPSLALRGAVMVVLLYGICRATGVLRWRPEARDRRLIGLRTLAEIFTTVTFLLALANMPIATATAVLQSAPLAVTLAAAVFLGEAVGWRRILALSVGFAGVLLIIRPGDEGFNIWALAAVAAVGGIVSRDLLTRQFGIGVPSLVVALVTSVAITVLGVLGSLVAPWPEFSLTELGLICFSSLVLIIGYVFAVRAMRAGEIAFVSPFRYSILLWALVLGVLIFDELPDFWASIGAVLVVGAGVFTFWREQVAARRAGTGRA